MEKQIMISISREFGTGGHAIAKRIAKDLDIALYDRNILDALAKEKGIDVESLEKYDEKPRNPILSRRVGEHSNSMEEHLVNMQFEFLQKQAEEGESFVVVGRCAETALKGRKGLITIFILGDKEYKLENIKRKFRLSDKEATIKMTRHDAKRKAYHNRYSDMKWGDSRGYDICINAGRLGLSQTVAVIEEYIKQRRGEAL